MVRSVRAWSGFLKIEVGEVFQINVRRRLWSFIICVELCVLFLKGNA